MKKIKYINYLSLSERGNLVAKFGDNYGEKAVVAVLLWRTERVLANWREEGETLQSDNEIVRCVRESHNIALKSYEIEENAQMCMEE